MPLLSGDSQSLSDGVTKTESKSCIRERPAHRTENAHFRKCQLLPQPSCSPTSPPLPDFQHDFHAVPRRESRLCKLCLYSVLRHTQTLGPGPRAPAHGSSHLLESSSQLATSLPFKAPGRIAGSLSTAPKHPTFTLITALTTP